MVTVALAEPRQDDVTTRVRSQQDGEQHSASPTQTTQIPLVSSLTKQKEPQTPLKASNTNRSEQQPQHHPTPSNHEAGHQTPNTTKETEKGGTVTPVSPPNDELNFPKLPSNRLEPQDSPAPSEPTQFVWRNTRGGGEKGEKGKGKQVLKTPDSAPLTRQGYRSGRLADDFWPALNAPQTPLSQKKTLRVIPILIKERRDERMEYLVNTKANSTKTVAQVHIAELLAGVPWTELRVKQHVVNEVAQALYKVFVFPNPSSNPLQKWKQGRWFANWEGDLEGDHVCTLYVGIFVQENKFKPRKGQMFGWQKVPVEIQERIQAHSTSSIEAITEDSIHWFSMTQLDSSTNTSTVKIATTHQNRFAALSEEDTSATEA
jgi:hypothetical protein